MFYLYLKSLNFFHWYTLLWRSLESPVKAMLPVVLCVKDNFLKQFRYLSPKAENPERPRKYLFLELFLVLLLQWAY